MFCEDLLRSIALYCDGAKARDGVGFSKSEAQEGKRLSAMAKAGIAYTKEDAQSVKGILGKYAKQITQNPEEIRKLKNGKIGFKQEPVEKSEYKYIATSPDHTKFYVYFFPWKAEFKPITDYIKKIKTVAHGNRFIRVVYNKNAKVTINGVEKTVGRWEIDLNSTSHKYVGFLAGKHKFAMDDVFLNDEWDELIKHTNIIYEEDGVFVVEAAYNAEMVEFLKQFKASYNKSDKRWTLEKGPILLIAKKFNLKMSKEDIKKAGEHPAWNQQNEGARSGGVTRTS